MILRGVITQDTSSGPGIVVVQGNPYPFQKAGMWQSPSEPRVGMEVDVTFNPEVGIACIVEVQQPAPPMAVWPAPVSEPQAGWPPAPAEMPLPAVPAYAPPPPDSLSAAPRRQRTGQEELADTLRLWVGVPDLVAIGVLLLGWFLLSTVSVNLFGLSEVNLSFWQLLSHAGSLNLSGLTSSNSDANVLMSLIGIVALLGALLPLVWRARPAHLAGVLPLVVMLLVAAELMHGLQRAAQSANSFFGNALGNSLAHEALKMVHIGLGFWVSLAASLWLAFSAVKKFATH